MFADSLKEPLITRKSAKVVGDIYSVTLFLQVARRRRDILLQDDLLQPSKFPVFTPYPELSQLELL